MLTNYLHELWQSAGIEKNDKILFHSSFKRTFQEIISAGYELNPIDILDSLIDTISPNGTLLLPTFNFSFNNGVPYNFFDTKSEMGLITEIARLDPRASRSLNPVYSFAAFGNDSDKFRDIDNKSWYSSDSPFGIVHKDNYKICILDLSERNSQTFAHYCEESFKVPWRFYKKFTGEYTDHNSNKNIKTYLGYVRKLDKGIVTTLDPAGELLWNRNLFYGHRPFEKSGIRYVYSQDYYNLFEELLEKRMSDPYYYTVESN